MAGGPNKSRISLIVHSDCLTNCQGLFERTKQKLGRVNRPDLEWGKTFRYTFESQKILFDFDHGI